MACVLNALIYIYVESLVDTVRSETGSYYIVPSISTQNFLQYSRSDTTFRTNIRRSMFGTTTYATSTPTCSGPMPLANETPTSFDTTVLDSHTIPIVFGTIGVILASVSLVVNVAVGMLQLRAMNRRARIEIEVGNLSMREPASAGVGSKPQVATVDVATNQKCHTYQLGHELDRLRLPTTTVPVRLICVPEFAMFTNTVACSRVRLKDQVGLLKSPPQYSNRSSTVSRTSLHVGNTSLHCVYEPCRPTLG
jgi:hypothetical protein